MKALVTGGAGFIGTNLIKRLLSDDYDVVSIDNYSNGEKKKIIKMDVFIMIMIYPITMLEMMAIDMMLYFI